jgi:hypothetical protein
MRTMHGSVRSKVAEGETSKLMSSNGRQCSVFHIFQVFYLNFHSSAFALVHHNARYPLG